MQPTLENRGWVGFKITWTKNKRGGDLLKENQNNATKRMRNRRKQHMSSILLGITNLKKKRLK